MGVQYGCDWTTVFYGIDFALWDCRSGLVATEQEYSTVLLLASYKLVLGVVIHTSCSGPVARQEADVPYVQLKWYKYYGGQQKIVFNKGISGIY